MGIQKKVAGPWDEEFLCDLSLGFIEPDMFGEQHPPYTNMRHG